MKSLGMHINFGIAGRQLLAQVQVDTTNGVGCRIYFSTLTDPPESETLLLQLPD